MMSFTSINFVLFPSKVWRGSRLTTCGVFLFEKLHIVLPFYDLNKKSSDFTFHLLVSFEKTTFDLFSREKHPIQDPLSFPTNDVSFVL